MQRRPRSEFLIVRDHLAPFAQEASRRKGETRLRGLSFLAARLSLTPKLEDMESELQDIIQAAENRDALTEEERVSFLAKLKGLKSKLRKIKDSVETPCLAFFGSEVGLGPAERGANLERIKTSFSSTAKIPAIDVTHYPESIYIPSMGMRVSAYGVFKVKPQN